MMVSNKIFDKIDNALKDKKDSELYIIYIGIFIVLATISYLYIFPISHKMLSISKEQVTTMTNKVNKERNYINSKTVNGDKNYYIKKEKKKIEMLKAQLSNVDYASGYIDNKLKSLSYLLDDDTNWANFINSIATNARKYNVNVNFIKSQFNKINYKKVEQVLDIKVDANGRFNNVMKFVNSVEESKLVVDVNDLNMTVKKGINVNFNIAVWGMKY